VASLFDKVEEHETTIGNHTSEISQINADLSEILNHFGTKVIKSITISTETDTNGNVYDYRLKPSDHLVIGAYAKDMAVTPVYAGDGSSYNYHCSSYRDWNLQAGTPVTATIYYIDK
jgi:hypothetical protein